MTLYSSIQMANNALRATSIGLQVVGQNIANVNTPGYIREEAVFEPAGTQKVGGLLLGMGVRVDGIIQKVDRFLQQRMRAAASDRASSETQHETYLDLEQLIGELSDTDLSTALNNFFGSIHEVLNQPESESIRNLAVLQGQTLATDISRLSSRTIDLRRRVNDRVRAVADEINQLTEEIRRLNVQIAETEGGDVSKSDAVGLRDQRGVALDRLAELIDIRMDEQPSGTVNVSINGTFLVFDGIRTEVEVSQSSDRGLATYALQFKGTQQLLEPSSGELAGLIVSRDEILGGFLDQLNDFASTLIFQFNRLHSSGQGLRGFQDVTSEFTVADENAPLDAAGLAFTPANGSFQLLVYNSRTGLTQTTDVFVDLDGLDDDDTTLAELAAALDAIDGISASVSPTRGLTISSDSADEEFAFANDTSGTLTALGINTFFSGSTAADIGVNQAIASDPAKFAASRGGIGNDTDNAIELADFLDHSLESAGGASLSVLYHRLVAGVTQGSAVADNVTEGFRVFEENLKGQHLAISGVSLDEEAVKLISFQRAFQATAKYIATLDELLGVLVNL
jgi:flagellar hook-associated protein 1 FlgK